MKVGAVEEKGGETRIVAVLPYVGYVARRLVVTAASVRTGIVGERCPPDENGNTEVSAGKVILTFAFDNYGSDEEHSDWKISNEE